QSRSSTWSTFDLGATLYSSNDKLDFSQYGKSVYLKTVPSADGQGQAAGLFTDKNMRISSGLSFTGMTTLNLGNGNDEIDISKAADQYLHIINTGGGRNIIKSENENVIINLQGSNDIVKGAGKGSIINIDPGCHATIYLSDDVIVYGLKPTDTVMDQAGRVLHGALGSPNTEAPFIYGSGIGYGLNSEGQLGVHEGRDTLYIANYKGGPSVSFSQQTGGIFVGTIEIHGSDLFHMGKTF